MSHYKPYPEYKDSGAEWIGKVPADWEVRRLRHIAVFTNSNVDKKSYDDQETVKLCNYTDVYYNEFIRANLGFMQATASPSEIAQFSLKKGDVIITKDSEDPADIGIPSIVSEDIHGVVCGYHLTLIRTDDLNTARYLHRVLQAHPTKAHFFVEAPGITRYGLGQDAIGDIRVCLPPVEHRAEIADQLDRETTRIDSLIAKKTRFIELLKEKRQALITHAVTKGLDPHAKMKDSGVEWIGDIPGHWEVRRMAMLFREAVRLGDPSLPVLSISIHDGITDEELAPEDRERQVYKIEDRTKYKRVVPNDLAYNMMRAWQGAFGAVTVDGLVSPAYVVAEPIISLHTGFVENLLRTSMAIEEMRRFSRGIADFRMRLYWDYFRDLKICLPPLEEQAQILSNIAKESKRLDALAGKTQHSIDLLKERRAALITAAVTGQIDLRGETI
ncbi:type I restriction enzyme, S subunit [Methylomagnum ishizawai]|uniref:Type I restriction enzyme, S subunit n=1 Tax=Methylomagnum ishizawai TaxID=1760988 RepID=A0A1Y6D5I4_9GAMM|nr:restriction endonuclease subunit S [Methylomagnum ishizawai]SMF97871.1 type I restriction enzyme, S subunit [Methylomagnum ishizawai]